MRRSAWGATDGGKRCAALYGGSLKESQAALCAAQEPGTSGGMKKDPEFDSENSVLIPLLQERNPPNAAQNVRKISHAEGRRGLKFLWESLQRYIQTQDKYSGGEK